MSITATRHCDGTRRCMITSLGSASAPHELFGAQDEPLHAFALFEGIDDRRDVLDRHAPIEKMIGFDEHRYTRGALVEAARRANAGLDLGEPALEQADLQRLVHCLGTLRRARALGIVVGPSVRAHEKVTTSLPHCG